MGFNINPYHSCSFFPLELFHCIAATECIVLRMFKPLTFVLWLERGFSPNIFSPCPNFTILFTGRSVPLATLVRYFPKYYPILSSFITRYLHKRHTINHNREVVLWSPSTHFISDVSLINSFKLNLALTV